MKNRPAVLLWCIVLVLSTLSPASQRPMDDFRLNQIGFYPDARKVAIILDTDASDFQVIETSKKKVVFKGKLSAPQSWAHSGETGRQAVFSEFMTPGQYQLQVQGKGTSHPFTISTTVLKDVAHASMRSYYFQRCSYELTEKLAGKWARPAGHPDTAVSFHPSSGKSSGKLSSPGGWYDAGDFGKYIVNSGISVGTLLAFHENFPTCFPDKSLDIPESGNGRPDILDEIRFNIDWMISMQDEDGGVFFKLTTLNFPGYIMPHNDTTERFIIGKSTTSTLNFAASLAMAARVYVKSDTAFARDCIVRAEKAWKWAVNNPEVAFNNPSDVRTGEYRDKSFSDEFTWAAAELYISTKKDQYAKFLDGRDLSYNSAPSWQNVHSLASLSLATIENGLGASTKTLIRNSIVKATDNWIGDMSKSLYRVPEINFIWGSNSIFANIGVAMIYAYKITGENHYIQAASEVADYLLGKNATTYSFMTGFGPRATANPHHRHSIAAAVGSIPGFLAGGPNAARQDSSYSPYSSRMPAKSYEDIHKSYASNEVAINWNAPSTFLFGSIDAILGKSGFTKKGPHALIVKSEGSGEVTALPLKKTYLPTETVTLKAKPKGEDAFSHWTGAASSTDNPTLIKLTSKATVTAVFINPSEMISNGDFSSGLPPWNFGVHQNASATGSIVGGKYRIAISAPGDQTWNIQLTQGGIHLEKGKTYEFSFSAQADSTRKIYPNVSMSQEPWESYLNGGHKTLEIGPEMKTYTLTFTMNATSDPNARVEINCGTSEKDVLVNNVSLREVVK